ncbi:MAG: Exodeoxyribonuclease 7 large subunit [Candidatus Tokpelaia sp. JSC161]|jgi:dTDP-4-amino-4,6-dideoxygalactose transaminase|nr:MAG: Exodeoxyribonuclease 7 large subunit [Candidatus Tokpelaia sp. JSC161]
MEFIDLSLQRSYIGERINAAVMKVISEGCYILGPEVSVFEKNLADYIGVKHAIACANGTDALLSPLMAIGIGRGDAVFCPSFTFAATAEAVALTGAEPVFVDVLPHTYNIDPDQLKRAISMIRREGRLNPKAVISVDLFGLPADYKILTAITAEENLFLIEDAAQSVGAVRDNIKCGAFGHVAATSFYPAKPLGCYGDGGAILTNNDILAKIVRSILLHGSGQSQYDNIRIGMNSRLDTIQAAILIEKLAVFEEEMEKRALITARYADGLADVVEVEVPLSLQNACRSAYAQYTIRAAKRDSLKAHLKKAGIPSVVYYPKPLHLQPAYCRFPRVEGGLPISDILSKKVLSLPMHPYLSYRDQDRVIQEIRKFYKG